MTEPQPATAGFRLLLASTSPRRRDLLRRAGIPFELVEPGDEPVGTAGSPAGLAEERASAKARGARWLAAVPELASGGDAPVVLGVDTVVELEGAEFGKARSRSQARELLTRLSGREHRVHSAIHLWLPHRGAADPGLRRLDTARVCFDVLGDRQLEVYLDSSAWQGKAGAYGIQDPEAGFAHLIEGELETVIGLSTRSVAALLSTLHG